MIESLTVWLVFLVTWSLLEPPLSEAANKISEFRAAGAILSKASDCAAEILAKLVAALIAAEAVAASETVAPLPASSVVNVAVAVRSTEPLPLPTAVTRLLKTLWPAEVASDEVSGVAAASIAMVAICADAFCTARASAETSPLKGSKLSNSTPTGRPSAATMALVALAAVLPTFAST